jgi:hypothetical protein
MTNPLPSGGPCDCRFCRPGHALSREECRRHDHRPCANRPTLAIVVFLIAWPDWHGVYSSAATSTAHCRPTRPRKPPTSAALSAVGALVLAFAAVVAVAVLAVLLLALEAMP